MSATVTLSGVPTEDVELGYVLAGQYHSHGQEWQSSSDGIDWTTVGTDPTFTPGDAEAGKSLRVVVQAEDNDTSMPSQATGGPEVVANVNDQPQGTVAVAGTAKQGETLIATDTVADADGTQGAALSYKWQVADGDGGWADIAGATGASFTLTQAEVGRAVRAVLSYTDDQGTDETVCSAATAAVENVNDPPEGALSVLGEPKQGETLILLDGVADPDSTRLSTILYRWQARGEDGEWADIADATGETFTLTQAEVGRAVRGVMTYEDGYGQTESVASDATLAVENVDDGPTGALAIQGAAKQGETLTLADTVDDADGVAAGARAYHWEVEDGNGDWVAIEGATGASFTLTQAEVGRAVQAVLTYTDGYGATELVASAATAAVQNIDDAPTGGLAIQGAAKQGETLTLEDTVADTDGIPGEGRFFRWQAADGNGGWADIAGATGASFTLTQAEVGRAVRAVLCYTDGQGKAEEVASAPTPAVENVDDAPTGGVVLIGNAEQGETLVAADTIMDADGIADDALAYRWQAQAEPGGAWVDIAEATAPIFTLTQAQVGRAVRAVLSYTDGGGASETFATAPTAAVANVNDAPEGSPVLRGATAIQGSTLTVDLSGISDADGLGAFAYAWSREDAPGSWAAIQGADADTYIPGEADVGARLKVEATYTDGMGRAERLEAATASPVINVNDAPTGAIALGGAFVRGQAVTASVASLWDADGMGEVSLAWERRDGNAWTPIAGAVGADYTPGAADIGHALRVTASWTDGHGAFERVSATTDAIAPRSVALPPPESGERDDNSAADEWTSAELGAMLADGDVFAPPPGVQRVELADGVLSYGTGTGEAFLARLYLGLLGREGDVGGLAFQARAVEDGASRADIAGGFLASAEYGAAHGPQSDAEFVEGLYLAFLGRNGGDGERGGWTDAMAAGLSRAGVAAGIADSAEAQAHLRASTTGVFVADLDGISARSLYLCALGREADAPGLSYWSDLIGSGADAAALGAGFGESDEFAARHAGATDEAFVEELYRNGLGREADAPGLDHWVGFLESGAMGRGEVAVRVSQAQEARDGLDWAL